MVIKPERGSAEAKRVWEGRLFRSEEIVGTGELGGNKGFQEDGEERIGFIDERLGFGF